MRNTSNSGGSAHSDSPMERPGLRVLPKDVLLYVVDQWLGDRGKLRALSDLDVAICNRSYRPTWIEVLAAVSIPSPFESLFKRMEMYGESLVWIFSHHVKVASLTVPAKLLARLVDVSEGTPLKSVKTISLHNLRSHQSYKCAFKGLLELLPSLTTIDVSSWKDISNDELEALSEIDSPRVKELVLGERRLSSFQVGNVVRRLGDSLEKVDGDMLLVPNINHEVLDILRSDCPRLSHVSVNLAAACHKVFLQFLHDCQDRIQHVELRGRISCADYEGDDFIKLVAAKIATLKGLVVDNSESQIRKPHELLCWMITSRPALQRFECAGQRFLRLTDGSSSFFWTLSVVANPVAVFRAMINWQGAPISHLTLQYVSTAAAAWTDPQSALRATFRQLLDVHGHSLKYFEISFSQLDLDFYFPVMEVVARCPHLHTLVLTGCRCVSSECYRFPDTAKEPFPELKSLVVSDALGLDDGSLGEILARTPQLESLELRYCAQLSQAALAVLPALCPHLTALKCRNLALTLEAQDAFRKELPRCVVEFKNCASPAL